MLAACASGGGSSSTITPPVATTPTTPPPTTPDPVNYDTAEYAAQPGLEQINVLPAYEDGASGEGVIVAVIDTGIDLNSTEFEGRIHPQSADLVIASVVGAANARANPTLQDEDDHGTPVASIIGAARDDVAVHGVAPEATLLIFRADDDSVSDPSIYGEAIAEGVTRAAQIGAGVINFSLGSDEAGARDDFADLYSYTAANDIVVTVAAGNGGNADPEASALGAVDATGGATIVVGSVDSDNQISSFSNHAGEAADIFLVAPGRLIPTVRVGTVTGDTEYFSGTSAATPHVAGAAALLRQLWPALSAREIVDILLDSATDLGASGADPIYGRGLLNVGAAVQPIGGVGMTTTNGVSVSVSEIGAVLPASFGAGLAALGEVVVLDSYNRDFRMNLGDRIAAFAPERLDLEGLFSPYDDYAYAAQRINARMTAQMRLISRDRSLTDLSRNRAASFFGADAQNDVREEELAFALTGDLGGGTLLTAAQGFSAAAGDRMTLATRRTPFMAQSAFEDTYLPGGRQALTAIVQTPLADGISADILVSYGEEKSAADTALVDDAALDVSRVATMRAGINLNAHGAALRFEQGLRHESGAIMGARFNGDSAATTVYGALDADWAFAPDWRLKGRYAAGYTLAHTDGLGLAIDGFTGLVTTQFSLALAHDGFLNATDSLWIGVSQPLQIESGAARLALPTDFNKWTETLIYSAVKAPLGFDGRRLDLEAGYRFDLAPFGAFYLNVAHQTFGGLDLPAQTSVMLRNGLRF